MAQHKEKPRYSKLVIAMCIFNVLAYTVACFAFMWNGKPINDVLTAFFFGCFGIEFASLAFIRGREIRFVEGNAGNKQPGHVEVIEETEGEKDAGKAD